MARLGFLPEGVERLPGPAALGGLDLGDPAEEGGDGAALPPERADAEGLDLVGRREPGVVDLAAERVDLVVERGRVGRHGSDGERTKIPAGHGGQAGTGVERGGAV